MFTTTTPQDPTLSHLNPVHILTHYFIKMKYSNTPLLRLDLDKWPLSISSCILEPQSISDCGSSPCCLQALFLPSPSLSSGSSRPLVTALFPFPQFSFFLFSRFWLKSKYMLLVFFNFFIHIKHPYNFSYIFPVLSSSFLIILFFSS